jgi:glycosyltransferase involved in cell wall biosynthesis
MNILVLSWRDPKHPLAGGAEQVMHEHMKGWVGAGHKVTLFSSEVTGLPGEETLDGIKIIRKGDQYLGVKIAAFFYWINHKRNYDFVVDQFHGIPFFTPWYVGKPKLAVLQEVAKRVWLLNELPIPFNWIVGLLGYFFEPLLFLFYRKVPFMVGSESAKNDLIKFGIPSKNITVVSHGVVVRMPLPFPKKEKIKTVIFLGALAKDKGIEDAIRAFSIINKKGKFQFWIVGKGSPQYLTYLISLGKKLGIGAKVKFWGFVDQGKKFELLAKSHLLVNPSVHEGWGLVNIEANAVGTPVVAYNSAGLTDSVKDGYSGIILKKNTSGELASTIQNLLNDHYKYEKMQKDAILWSNNFSWQKSRKLSLDLTRLSSL